MYVTNKKKKLNKNNDSIIRSYKNVIIVHVGLLTFGTSAKGLFFPDTYPSDHCKNEVFLVFRTSYAQISVHMYFIVIDGFFYFVL